MRPGDVVSYGRLRGFVTGANDEPSRVVWPDGSTNTIETVAVRSLIVVDSEDREQAQRLMSLVLGEMGMSMSTTAATDVMQAALRPLVPPAWTPEPTDPKALVTDRRDNVWRLLADGEWVCTSGPDIGEYLSWSGLLDRGPLEVES